MPRRARNRASLVARLQQVFLTRTYAEWEALLLANDIPVGAINNLAQVSEHPQVKARATLIESDHPQAGRVRMVRSPVRLSKTRVAPVTPAPMLGQHTAEVLRDLLGLNDGEIAALKAAGVFGIAPR